MTSAICVVVCVSFRENFYESPWFHFGSKDLWKKLLNFNVINYFFVNFFESKNILFEVGLIFKFTTVLKRYI